MSICNFCDSSFYNKSNLTKHQKTSKSCLLIQNGLKKQLNSSDETKGENKLETKPPFQCKFCTKTLSSKQMLNGHLEICKRRKKQVEEEDSKFRKITLEMNSLKEEFEKLKDKTKPSTTNNITITNNTDNSSVNNYCSLLNYMTPEVIRDSFKNFTIGNLLTGSQKDLADMTIKKFFTGKEQPLYICKDRSRNKFVYTNEENKETEDANAIILRTLIHNGIAPLLKKLYHEEYVKLHNELARCKRTDDNGLIIASREDIKELDEAYKQFNILKDAEDYISHLSKCLPSSIKDRIYQDALIEKMTEDKESNSDIEFHKQLEMIGDYTVSELREFKEYYKSTGLVKGPKEFLNDKELTTRFLAFLKEP